MVRTYSLCCLACQVDSYAGAKALYMFRCEQGYEWQTNGARIFRGTWCPICAYEGRRLKIELMRDLATQRGGRCVSERYVNNASKLEWGCARGNRWPATPSTIRAGHWCAQCHFLSLVTLPQTRCKRRYEAANAWASTYLEVFCKRVILSKVASLASGRLTKPLFDQLAGSPLTASML